MRSPALALALTAALTGCPGEHAADEDKTPPVEVRCVPARHVELDTHVMLRGRTAPPPGGVLEVAAQVPGRIVQTRVREGDALRKGAVVAVLDDLAPRAAASQAGASLGRAKAADLTARAALARVKMLAEQGLASAQDLEEAMARADSAKADVSLEAAALRLASGTLGRIEVRSTFEGVVTKVWRGDGALVDGTSATPIVELASTEVVEMVADATERDLARVAEGQAAAITLSSSGLALVGRVSARSRALDGASGLGVVRVRIEGEGATALPPLGAFGKVRIVTGHREGVLVIPPAALRGAVADGAEVAVCNGDVIALRTVTVGYRDAEQLEIVEGLAPGDEVAIDSVLGLENGTAIARVDAGVREPPGDP